MVLASSSGRLMLGRLSAQKNIDAMRPLEATLADAMHIATTVGGWNVVLKQLGQLFVRVGVLCTGKGAVSREKRDITLPQIKAAFLADVGGAIGSQIAFSKWTDLSMEPVGREETTATTPKATFHSTTLADHQSTAWLLAQQGYKVGGFVTQKGIEFKPEGLFAIFQVEPEIVLRQVCTYGTTEPATAKTTASQLLKEWVLSKRDAPELVFDEQLRPAKQVALERLKAELFGSLVDFDAKMIKKAASQSLCIWSNPPVVRTNGTKIKTGALVLVPIVPSVQYIALKSAGNMQWNNSLGKHKVLDDMCEFFILQPPKLMDKEKVDEKEFLAMFWYVTPTSDRKQANLEFATEKFEDVEITILKNSEDILPFTPIHFYVKPHKAVQVVPVTTPVAKKAKVKR